MKKSHEYEIKLMLTEKEYEKLAAISDEDAFSQTNFYFDTADFELFKSLTVIRVRKKKNQFELTVKTKNSDAAEAGVVSMIENTIKLDEEEAAAVISGQLDIGIYLSSMPLLRHKKLKNVGRIETFRKNFIINNSYPAAELDKSTYEGITDYELEWEIDKETYEQAVELLLNLGLDMKERETALSKFGRFVKAIES